MIYDLGDGREGRGGKRAQRIKTGFHRLGLTVAVISLLPAIAIFSGFAMGSPMGSRAMDFALSASAIGILAYPVARTLAWIIAGFVGD